MESLAHPVILVVEDNPDDRELICLAFEKTRHPHRLVKARDGVEALDYLFGDQPAPQVVLLDLRMPRIDGLEVLRRIRAHQKTKLQPVVIMTSSAEQEDVVRGYQLGANSYIRKPIGFGDLVDAARALSSYWLGLNRPPCAEGAG